MDNEQIAKALDTILGFFVELNERLDDQEQRLKELGHDTLTEYDTIVTSEGPRVVDVDRLMESASVWRAVDWDVATQTQLNRPDVRKIANSLKTTSMQVVELLEKYGIK